MALAFGQQARAAGIAQPMGSKGDCFDNAVAESFIATINKELVHRRAWSTKTELRRRRPAADGYASASSPALTAEAPVTRR